MPAQKKRPSAAQRRQAQRQRGDRPAPAPMPAAQPGTSPRRAALAAERGRPGRARRSRGGQFFATLGKSRWPTIIVAATIVAALVASGVVLYTQPGAGIASPTASMPSAPPSSPLAPTPTPAATP